MAGTSSRFVVFSVFHTHPCIQDKANRHITSTYSEEIYTTRLDETELTVEQRNRADRIAREIEKGNTYSRMELESERRMVGT